VFEQNIKPGLHEQQKRIRVFLKKTDEELGKFLSLKKPDPFIAVCVNLALGRTKERFCSWCSDPGSML
jgi:hypothetical protein